MENSKEIIEAQLCAYIDGELSPTEQVEIERHLASNPQHRALIDDLRQMRGFLQGLPRARVPVELNENLTGSLERSALLDPSEGEESAVVGRINRWPQWTAVAAVLILAVGLAIVVYSVLPPKANNPLVAIGNERQAGRPMDELRGKEGDLTNWADRDKAQAKVGKGAIAEKSYGVESEILQQNLQKQMNDVVRRNSVLDPDSVETARRRLAANDGLAASTYCLFVSADNAATANEQVTSYFKTNGILYAVNDAKNLDQLAYGRPVRDQETYGVKAKGAAEQLGGAGYARGGGGGAADNAGGFGGAGSGRGGYDKPAPDVKVESNKEPSNAALPQPEEKSNPTTTTGAYAEKTDAGKAFSAAKPAASDPVKAVDDKDGHAARGSSRNVEPIVREEVKKDTTALSTNPAPVFLKPSDVNSVVSSTESLSIVPNSQAKFAEQVIVARMSRKQLGELQTKLTSQGAGITQAPLGRLAAVVGQQGQQLADNPVAGGVSVALTPAPALTDANIEAVEKRADRAAATSPASQPMKDSGATTKKSEAPGNQAGDLTLNMPVDELLDVLIVVQGGEALEAGAKPVAQPAEIKAGEAKPAK